MDDKHLIGGYTIPVNLSNTFFGLAYLNLEGQVDKELSFQRQSSARIDPTTGRLVETATHLLRREWRWAFDEVRSVRWGIAARFNRDVIQGTDLFSLTADNSTGEQLGLQVAWVHDDTRSPRLNIHQASGPSWPNTSSMSGTATVENDTKAWPRPRPAGPSAPSASMPVATSPCRPSIPRYAYWRLSIGQRSCSTCLAEPTTAFPWPAMPTPPLTLTSLHLSGTPTPLRGFQKQRRNGANMTVANAEVGFHLLQQRGKNRLPQASPGCGLRMPVPHGLTSTLHGRQHVQFCHGLIEPHHCHRQQQPRTPTNDSVGLIRFVTGWLPIGPTGSTTASPCLVVYLVLEFDKLLSCPLILDFADASHWFAIGVARLRAYVGLARSRHGRVLGLGQHAVQGTSLP